MLWFCLFNMERQQTSRQLKISSGFLAKQWEPCCSEPPPDPTFLPFCALLDSVFSVMKSIITFDLAHTLLLKPRYDFGIHDWKHGEETRLRAAGGEGRPNMLTIKQSQYKSVLNRYHHCSHCDTCVSLCCDWRNNLNCDDLTVNI